MKVITVLNEKNNSGCTTVSMLFAMQAASMKLSAGLVEISGGSFDAPLYCGINPLSGQGVFDDGKKTGIKLYGNSGGSFNEFLAEADKCLDVLVIDTNSVEEKYMEAADIIIIPAVLDSVAVKHALSTIDRVRKLNFPSSAIKVFVNKNESAGMSAADLAEVFKNVEVSCFINNSPAWGRAVLEGKAYSVKPEKEKAFSGAASAAKDIINSIKPKAVEKRAFYGQAASLAPAKPDSGAPRAETSQARVLDEKTNRNIAIKKGLYAKLFAEIDIRKMESEASTGEDKKARMNQEVSNKIHELIDKTPGMPSTREEAMKLEAELFNEVTGYGPLEEFLSDPTVTEIMVNRHDVIYVERRGMLTLTDAVFTDDGAVRRVIERIVMPLGRRIDESSPHVDARLPDGSRVNAIIPPLALDGPVLTIRKFSDKKLSIQDMINFGSLTEEAGEYLKTAVAGKKNIIISGGTGSGKTTLLNVLSSFIPSNERILTIEDSAELKLEQFHVVRLETRPANLEGKGEVTIRDLVRNALRMRPDRIIVGECRGGEALDMLQAMNTGHEGSMTTLHANTPRDAISRLEVMVLTAGVDLPVRAIKEQIRGAVNIIVQQSRMADGARKITHIAEITGMDNDVILMQNAFEFEHDTTPGAAPSAGRLKKNNLAGK